MANLRPIHVLREPRGGHSASPAPAVLMASLGVAPRWPGAALALLCRSVCPRHPARSSEDGKLVKGLATLHQRSHAGVPPHTHCTPTSLSMPARRRARPVPLTLFLTENERVFT